MYYILDKHIALRSWRLARGYYTYHRENPTGLNEREFETLLKCDAMHDLEETETLASLVERNLAHKCEKGEFALTEWQKHRHCDNRLMPKMNIQITGKCNYNCLHCFNAADNNPLQSELTYEEICALLDSARECGVYAITITGGEPMAHKRFREILSAIYERDMFVFEINTNGHYINQDLLDFMKRLGCHPLMKISFDGIGRHDWLRNRAGAEQDAIRSIKLCVDNGFAVMAQVQLHKKNIDTMPETLDMLNSIGVHIARVFKTTESPRWIANAEGQTLSVTEHFDACIELIRGYAQTPHTMDVTFWNFAHISPRGMSFSPSAAQYSPETFRESLPLCRGVRGMVAIGANGNVYPCLQMSGHLDAHGISFGNVKTDGLKCILQGGKYMDTICQTVHDRMAHNGKCKDCRYLKYCGGGCIITGGLYAGGDMLAPDLWHCTFYERGYYKKLIEALPGWKNLCSAPV